MQLLCQNTFKAVIKDNESKQTLSGVSVLVKSTTKKISSDKNGDLIINDIPNGEQEIELSLIGYKEQLLKLTFPLDKDSIYNIYLVPTTLEIEEVTIVSSTRSSRRIENVPTRVEAITSGELEEKSVMQPANIRMILTESTGIQVQQTSQVSASASLRIQGLDGKYTQMLQDGLPLYSGYSGGLSLLQVPPLNLKRVEVIKGSTSTLYGGGAIAGLVNFVTKVPEEKREMSLLINGNISSALDASAFYSEKYGKTGLILYATSNLQKQYDVNKDGFSDIPMFSRFSFNPEFFYYIDSNSSLSFGINAGIETRKGGDMQVLKDKADINHSYYENNVSSRYSSQIKYNKTFSNNSVLSIKNSFGLFKRGIERNNYDFNGRQFSEFTEVSYLLPHNKSEWIFGLNHVYDNFRQLGQVQQNLNYTNSVLGLFIQNTYNITEKFIAESGLRLDYTNRKDLFALPRLSMLYKINAHWSSRIGGGLGYKVPNIFSEEAEERAFQGILPLDFNTLKPERSLGINADVNYRTIIDDKFSFSINQMFFYTIIKNPLLLTETNIANEYAFHNDKGNLNTRGTETNLKIQYDEFSCYLGYTFTDAAKKVNNIKVFNPLTAKHRINANVMYEIEDKLRLTYELFYIGKQQLSSGEYVRSYWMMGTSAQYSIGKLTLFVNFENFTDSRQSRWQSMYSGSMTNPEFKEIWAPTDGFIANTGFKINF